MASDRGRQDSRDEKSGWIYEWAVPNVARLNIVNRNVGSPSTINLLLTFPTPSSLDTSRLAERIVKVQQLWPLLSVTITDQRTIRPKLQYNHSQWTPQQILLNQTYVANPSDPQAERDAVYDRALRLFQRNTAFDHGPLWKAFLFSASSKPQNKRLYLALTLDHVIIDGRGTVKLAKSLVANDISQLPQESIELYERVGLGQDMDEMPPYSFIASTMLRGALYHRLPAFMQRRLGIYPTWPLRVKQPTIDSPWKMSILDIPSDLVGRLKEVGERHGLTSLNATLHAAWMVAIWALLIKRDEAQITDVSIKDLRDPSTGDPYCVGSHPTAYMWSSGLMTGNTRFWNVAKSYAAVSTNPQSHADGTNIMRMLNLSTDTPMNPADSKHRTPDSLELPVGDKRAHTRREEDALAKINSPTPYGGMSGIWSNLSFVGLPEGAIDAVIGTSGNATGTAFNTILLGHENGARMQNSYSDGAAMRERDVKKAEVLFLGILQRLVAQEDRDLCLGDLEDIAAPIKSKL